jgi:3',5'-cyclic AMP phosphodiesterase CpdA
MRIAHISDLHIAALHGVPLKRFLNKRVTGLANLMTMRRGAYSLDVFDRLVDDLLQEAPDHVICSGDVSNLALETEFQAVFDRFKLLGGYRRVSVVPGNHDVYTHGAAAGRRFEGFFYPFMFPQFTDLDVDLYPFVKQLEGVAVIGLCSAQPTLPFFAWGRLGDEQLARLRDILARDQVQAAFKIVVLHHHLHERELPEGYTARLRDLEAFVKVLLDGRVDLVLHGHDHHPHFGAIGPGDRRVPVLSPGSSTRLDPDQAKVARYNVYTIENGRLETVETKLFDTRKRKFIWRF